MSQIRRNGDEAFFSESNFYEITPDNIQDFRQYCQKQKREGDVCTGTLNITPLIEMGSIEQIEDLLHLVQDEAELDLNVSVADLEEIRERPGDLNEIEYMLEPYIQGDAEDVDNIVDETISDTDEKLSEEEITEDGQKIA